MSEGFGHGKVILLGEHAVVYGLPALAAGMSDAGFVVTARPAQRARVIIPQWKVDLYADPSSEDDLTRAMGMLFEQASGPARTASLEVDPQIPSRAGLGSSAALSVGAARALSGLAGEKLTATEAESWAARAEEVFHGAGRASGVDGAVAARGGVVRFVKGQPPEPLRPKTPLPAVLAYVEPRASTRAMVEKVAQAREQNRGAVDAIFTQIGELVDQGADALRRGDLPQLAKAMGENQKLLTALDLRTPALAAACDRAEQAGAMAAKLTGAGGGGCIVALAAPTNQAAVARALEPSCLWVRAVTLGAGGAEHP